LLPIVFGAALYDKMPEQVPIHWNAAGEVDGYAPRIVAIFGMPLFMAALQLLMFFVVLNDPKKQNQSDIMRAIGFWAMPTIGVVMYAVTLFMALGYDLPIVSIVMVLCGMMFIICGNYMPKTKQNYTIGIKLPWTLDDPENWYKTHRLASYLWVAGGIVFLASAFIPKMSMYVTLGAALVMVFVPTVYSYMLYRKKQKA
ncbi:MAG: SdpI family protein, partial [Firmicutes bacterium]|nr:SdpI family protein [Bacillota bacterium]